MGCPGQPASSWLLQGGAGETTHRVRPKTLTTYSVWLRDLFQRLPQTGDLSVLPSPPLDFVGQLRL
jgi:hypothetical protein